MNLILKAKIDSSSKLETRKKSDSESIWTKEMDVTEKQQALLRMLPGVDYILELSKADPFFNDIPKSVLVRSIRSVVENLRTIIMDGEQDITETKFSDSVILERIKNSVKQAMTSNLKRVVNATGIVVHTNLGRSLLAKDAVENLLTDCKQIFQFGI